MNSREAFEAYGKGQYPDWDTYRKISNGNYSSLAINAEWRAWQAAVKWQQDKDKQEDGFWEAMNIKPLRDEFAKAAMQGLLTADSYDSYYDMVEVSYQIAEASYQIADAMLKEREK